MAYTHPVAYINFEVYEDGDRYLGLAKATLPDISFITASLSGAGLGGNIEVPLIGMIDNLELGLDFLSVTDAAVTLMEPRKHQLELRAVAENWNVEEAEAGIVGERYLFVAMPKSTSFGTISPATAASVSGKYAVYYTYGEKDGTKLWEIDKRNIICEINGVDYMADIRTKLGR